MTKCADEFVEVYPLGSPDAYGFKEDIIYCSSRSVRDQILRSILKFWKAESKDPLRLVERDGNYYEVGKEIVDYTMIDGVMYKLNRVDVVQED